MRTTMRITIGFLAVFVFTGLVHAAPAEWKVDKAHSGLYFDIRHIYATVRGHFNDFTGTIRFDPEDILKGSCEFEAAVESIDTNINQRDTHLRGDDFFSAKSFPTLKFKSTRIVQKEGNQFDMIGNLTIKDVTREVRVPFVYFKAKDNPSNPGEMLAGFEGRLSIDRLEYHVGKGNFYKMGLVDKDVLITISLEVLREK